MKFTPRSISYCFGFPCTVDRVLSVEAIRNNTLCKPVQGVVRPMGSNTFLTPSLYALTSCKT